LIYQYFSILIASSLLTTTCLAGDGSNVPAGGGYFDALPIVLTPSRLPQPLNEAPAAVTVIDRELIEASGYRDIARLLRLVPGMQVGQERSGVHWVTYHGLGNDSPADMQVLIDGRAVYSPSVLGGVDWLALPVTFDEIERIEVVRGTDAVAYGPNAFLGVINIITRNAGSAPGSTATVTVGEAGIRDVRAAWDSEPGSHAVRLAASSRRDDGYAGLHDSSRMNVFSLRSDNQLTDNDQVTLRITASDGTRETGYADSPFHNDGERTIDTRGAAIQAQWRHAPNAEEELLVNYFRNEISAREQWMASGPRIDLLPARVMVNTQLNRNRDIVRNSLEVQQRTALAPTAQAVWGGEARQEEASAPFIYFGHDDITTRLYRLFGNLEWRFSANWTSNVGAMMEKYSDDRARYSPRAFVNWQLAPHSTVRAGYSRAWRDRNLIERYGDVRVFDPADGRIIARPYIPNPDLEPPRIDSLELGWLQQFQPGDTRLDMRLFNERIVDFVTRRQMPITPDLPVLALPPINMLPTQYYNLESPVRLRGIEYQVQTKPWHDGRIILNHVMINRHTDNPAVKARVAPYTASLSWLQNWNSGWTSMVTALRMGPLAGGDGFFANNGYIAPAYTTYDFNIQRRLRFGARDVVIALSGINLGPKHQEIADRSEQALHPEGPVNPVSRMVFLSVSVNAP
jgi:iron complex outermembrane receptor protein